MICRDALHASKRSLNNYGVGQWKVEGWPLKWKIKTLLSPCNHHFNILSLYHFIIRPMDKKVYEFISETTSDPIVERRTCPRTGEEFAIYQSDVDMLEKVSPSIAGKKFLFPLPTLSPESRFRRMMMFRNERKLYKRKCSKTGKNIVALYPEQYE